MKYLGQTKMQPSGGVYSPKLVVRVKRAILALLLRLTPVRNIAVVSSGLPFEANAIEVLRYLNSSYGGRIVWLVAEASLVENANNTLRAHLPASAEVEIYSKRQVRGFIHFLMARVVFFTSLVYSGPSQYGPRVYVNLWHGDGPKKTTSVPLPPYVKPSQFLISGTWLWGVEKAKGLNCAIENTIFEGNPAIDQLSRPVTDSSMRAIGLDPSWRLVIWAPTYRHASIGSAHESAWSDSEARDPFFELAEDIEMVEFLRAERLNLIVKPHPLDVEAFNFPGVTTLTDEFLMNHGVGFYQLLGRADALITDYSSIWTDFMALDRSVGLYCPDLKSYGLGRGFSVDKLHEYAPGPVFSSVGALRKFLASVAQGEDPGASLRREAIERIGIVTSFGATRRTMETIGTRSSRFASLNLTQ